MKTLLQINVVINKGSTGRIAEEIGQRAIAAGWKSHIAYGRDDRPSQSNKIRIGTDWDMRLHGVQTRVLDNHSLGFSSRGATTKLIKRIDDIKPDIIHLHNLHGYYINIEVLFDYLATKDIPIVWTLHDCWAFTGHCTHFEAIGCMKWKTHCYECPLKTSYPASLLIDRSKKNFNDKRRFFNSVTNLNIIPVSNWLHNHLKESFLSSHNIQTIHNGIDLNVFSINGKTNEVREKYSVGDEFVVLGVSNIWNKGKGLNDFIELSNMLGDDTKIILVGMDKEQIGDLPKNIIGIERTESQQELAELYSMADLFVNPTYGDTFPTTNLESLSSGTPVLTYRTGGSPESVTKDTGFVVEQGDLDGVLAAINQVRQKGKGHYTSLCRQHAEQYFNKDDRYQEYLELYERLLENK